MPSLPPTFRPASAPARAEQRQVYDARRGSAASRGYNKRWAKARKTHLSRSPLCIGCAAVGIAELATIVDHVEPHGGDTEKFWNSSMWQSCCKWHHDSIKQALERMWLAGRIPTSELWLTSATAVRLTRSEPGPIEAVGHNKAGQP